MSRTDSASTPRKVLRALITIVCTTQALLMLWTFLCLLGYIGLRHPTLDQFRLYPIYLDQSFPANVVQIENGHRPVLPAIIRVAEIHLTDADQMIQLVIGALGAIAIAFAGALVHRRFDRANAPSTAIAGLAGCMGVLWMANARMLLHGNESVHAYFAGGFALLAFLIAWRASQRRCVRCLGVAFACATAAGLSFGPGLAAFGLILIAPILAGNRRFFVHGLGFSALFAVGYLLLLPQGDEARSVVRFAPLAILDHLTTWLGSPLVHAGLGANPALGLHHAQALSQSPLAGLSADATVWWTLRGAVAGLFALTLYSSWRSYRDGNSTPKLVLAGLGLSWFAIGAGLLVCLARNTYFSDFPEQRFADRYLLWSCLFFLGAWFQIQGRLARTDLGLVVATAALMFAVQVMKPADRIVQGWAVAVHQINERFAAAMLGDVDSPELYASDAAAPEEARRRTVALFREHRLGAFAGPMFDRVTRFKPSPVAAPLPVQPMVVFGHFVDRNHGSTESVYGRFDLDRDVPGTALLTTPTQGVCGILRRAAYPTKARDIWKPGKPFNRGMTGYSRCRADETAVLWSLDTDVARPVNQIEWIRP